LPQIRTEKNVNYFRHHIDNAFLIKEEDETVSNEQSSRMSNRRRGRYYGDGGRAQVASSSEAPLGGVAHFTDSNNTQRI